MPRSLFSLSDPAPQRLGHCKRLSRAPRLRVALSDTADNESSSKRADAPMAQRQPHVVEDEAAHLSLEEDGVLSDEEMSFIDPTTLKTEDRVELSPPEADMMGIPPAPTTIRGEDQTRCAFVAPLLASAAPETRFSSAKERSANFINCLHPSARLMDPPIVFLAGSTPLGLSLRERVRGSGKITSDLQFRIGNNSPAFISAEGCEGQLPNSEDDELLSDEEMSYIDPGDLISAVDRVKAECDSKNVLPHLEEITLLSPTVLTGQKTLPPPRKVVGTFFAPEYHRYGLEYALGDDGRLYFHYVNTNDVYIPLSSEDLELFAATYPDVTIRVYKGDTKDENWDWLHSGHSKDHEGTQSLCSYRSSPWIVDTEWGRAGFVDKGGHIDTFANFQSRQGVAGCLQQCSWERVKPDCIVDQSAVPTIILTTPEGGTHGLEDPSCHLRIQREPPLRVAEL
ncbi:hypothetical protein QBC34DRAFT_430140 [Podospora aff. communis PSN243]|uniref:Uncharacterized protein n=1 Tax=Podospora aff. communis PSN243 TaxID=3040156 RepID=A0AAV9G7F8_9PEZI|nr:hypothetical protein QBC34DRAFT_430140 [Podospora aff. communis PSN243]